MESNAEPLIDPALLRHLDGRGLDYCLVGSAALAVYGYLRSTDDLDLMTMDSSVIQPAFWAGFTGEIDCRAPDDDDPLGGMTRVETALGQVDLIVGRGPAMRFAVSTARVDSLLPCKVVTQVGLVLLKLEAGSPTDDSDIHQLVEHSASSDRSPGCPRSMRTRQR